MHLPDRRPLLVAEGASLVAVAGRAGLIGLEEDVVQFSLSSEAVRHG